MEVREMFGVFVGGIIALALVATLVRKDSQTVEIANAFMNGFANDIRASTFQGGAQTGQ